MKRSSRLAAVAILATGLLVQPAIAQSPCGTAPCVFQYRGALQPPAAINPDGTWTKEIALGDLDNNGVLDILMMQKQPQVFSVIDNAFQIRPGAQKDAIFLGSGPIQLALDPPANTYAHLANAFMTPFTSTRGYDAEIADFDGDGHLDILRPDTPGRLIVLWGDGTGKMTALTDVLASSGGDPNAACSVSFVSGSNLGGNYANLAVADLDGDGDLDFQVAQWYDCGVNPVFENLAAPPDNAPRTFRHVAVPGFTARWTHTVDFGDANGDGLTDALLGHGVIQNVHPELYLGTGTFAFEAQPSVTFTQINDSPLRTTTVADLVGEPGGPVDDLDGDDVPDVFLAQAREDGDFGLYTNTNNPGLPFTNLIGCTGACSTFEKYDVRYGDFDLDGDPEAVFVNQNIGEQQIDDPPGGFIELRSFLLDTALQVFRFAPDGTYLDVSGEFVDFLDSGDPFTFDGINRGGTAIAAGDLDGDGDLDLVLGGAVDGPSSQPNPPSGDVDIYGAAFIYENLALGRLADRSLSSEIVTLEAIRTFTGADGATVTGSAQVVFEAGESVRLEPGFSASPQTGGSFTMRIRP